MTRRHACRFAPAIAVVCLAICLIATSAAQARPSSPGTPHTHSRLVSGKYLPLAEVPATARGRHRRRLHGEHLQHRLPLGHLLHHRLRVVQVDGRGRPDRHAEFANAVEDWQLKATRTFITPKKLADGSKYQEMRVNGRFDQRYDLQEYPLDSQQIALYLEDSRRTVNEAVYLADSENAGVDASMNIPGWTVSGLTSQALIHDYQTDFGDSSAGPDSTRFTSLVYSVEIERDISYFYWKLLFPLVIVLLTNWLALLLRPHRIDLRTGMPATAPLDARSSSRSRTHRGCRRPRISSSWTRSTLLRDDHHHPAADHLEQPQAEAG